MIDFSELPPETLLAARGIEVRFPDGHGTRAVVDRVDFHVPRNRVTALVGSSGSGKTQLLHALLGLTQGKPGLTAGQAVLQPEPGQIIPLLVSPTPGACPRFVASYENIKFHVCVVFQGSDSHLAPFHTVRAQFLAHRRLLSRNGERASTSDTEYVRAKLEPLFPDRDSRDEVAGRFPAELSGGQRTRVSVCLALASPAPFLIADEPTTGLDPGLRAEIYLRLRHEIEQSKRSLLLITHDVDLVARIADDIWVMRDGLIVEHLNRGADGELRDPYSRMLFQPLDEIACGLGEDREAPGRKSGAASPRASGDSSPSRSCPARPSSQRAVLLQASGLRKGFRSRASADGARDMLWAVNGVDLRLLRGESVGLVGESGCGKSTLARLLAGLLPPDEGSVVVFGGDSGRAMRPGDAAYRSCVQLLHQNPDALLHPRVTVRELCRDSLQLWRRNCRFEAVEDFLRYARVDDSRADQYPQSLSGGERRRIGLSRVLAGRPQLVIADEIASGLDRVLQAWILRYLRGLREEQTTLVIISHDLDFVRHACDRVLIMKAGKIEEECAAKDLCKGRGTHCQHTLDLLRSESLDPGPACERAMPLTARRASP